MVPISSHKRAIISKVIGTVFIVASGALLHLDVIFDILGLTVNSFHGWPDQDTYIHYLGQTLCPLFIIIGFYLRNYSLALLVPLFFICLQFLFTTNENMKTDDALTYIYASGFLAIVVVLMFVVKISMLKLDERKNQKIKIMEELINLDQKTKQVS